MALRTPVLTAKQQQQSLSSKKKSNRITIKNVLGTPFSDYWPFLDENDTSVLAAALNKNLVSIRSPKINVPWKELKDLPRDQRKAFRLKFSEESSSTSFNPPSKNDRLSVVFGVNEVTKLLEKNSASSILINSDVNPRLMVRHIIDAAVLKSVPILVMSNMKEIIFEKAGIKATAMAFKSLKVNDSSYEPIQKCIEQLYCKYPVPQYHLNLERRLSFSANKIDATSDKQDMEISSEEEKQEEKEEIILFKYLIKPSSGGRAFVPPLSKASQNRLELENKKKAIDKSDEISLEEKLSPPNKKLKVEVMEKKQKTSYKSLLVKRVIPDANRNKKKIQRLKAK